MIYPPFFPPDKQEPSEEQVYNTLKKLDMQRYDVFYNRRFVGMHPGEKKNYEIDFIIVDLEGGRCHSLLVLEVKGGMVKYNTRDKKLLSSPDEPDQVVVGVMGEGRCFVICCIVSDKHCLSA